MDGDKRMNGHIVEQLDAYTDGELTDAQRRRVAAHLKMCAECRAALAQQEQLRMLLHSALVPEPRLTPERFTAQVRLRLAPREAPAQRRRGWAIPGLLVGAWAFIEAVWLVSSGVMAAAALGLGEALGLPGLLPAGGPNLWQVLQGIEVGAQGALALFSFLAAALLSALLPLALLGGMAILFWTWWFAWRPHSVKA